MIITSEFYPYPGAAASRTEALFDLLNLTRVSVEVLTSKSVRGENKKSTKSIFSLPDHRSSLARRFIQEILMALDFSIRLFFRRNKINICFITSPPFFMASICALFAKLFKIPYVFDVRDRYPSILFEQSLINKQNILGKILLLVEKVIYTNAKVVTFASSSRYFSTKKELPQIRTLLIRNGFDEKYYPQKRNSIKFSEFTVIYHGRFGRLYDYGKFVEVIKNVKQLDPAIKFKVVGDFNEECRNKLAGFADIYSALPLDELAQFVSRCHLGICLLKECDSCSHVIPAKLYDFIGAGIPFLASGGSEYRKFIERNTVGIDVSGCNSMQISEYIVKLRNDSEFYNTYCSRIINSRLNYTRKRQFQPLVNLFK